MGVVPLSVVGQKRRASSIEEKHDSGPLLIRTATLTEATASVKHLKQATAFPLVLQKNK